MLHISGDRPQITRTALAAITSEAEAVRQSTGTSPYFRVAGEYALQLTDGTTRQTEVNLLAPDPPSPDGWTVSIKQSIIDLDGAQLGTKQWTVGDHESDESFAELARYIPEVTAAALQALRTHIGEQRAMMPLDPELHDVVIRATDFGDLTALDDIDRESWRTEKDQPFDALNCYGLEPVRKQEIGEGIDICISRIFTAEYLGEAKNQRPMVVVYPSVDGQPSMPKIYYKSNSQGNWRYLAGYSPDDGWYGKGQSEYALAAPMQIQRSLAAIEADEDPVSVSDAERSHIIALVAPKIERSALETYPDDSMHFSKKTLELGTENDVDPLHPQAPDFSNRICTWNSSNALYGQFVVDEFLSHDETIRYAFAHDTDGRSWMMQVNSAKESTQIRPNGLLNEYFYVPHESYDIKLDHPAYEYISMASARHISGYHPEDDLYAECFGLGLSRNPIIRSYLHTIDQRDITWKTRLEGVPVWNVGSALRSNAWLETMAESGHSNIANAIERSLQVVAEMERNNPRRVMDYSDIVRDLDSFCTTTFIEGDRIDVPTADDATLVPGSPAFEKCGYESGEFVAYDTLLQELGYTEVRREKEKYAKDVYHLYLESEQFPDQPLVLSVDSVGMVGLSKKLSMADAPMPR